MMTRGSVLLQQHRERSYLPELDLLPMRRKTFASG
jgi:hypothetical protein